MKLLSVFCLSTALLMSGLISATTPIYKVSTTIKEGERVLGSPVVVIENGKIATIKIGRAATEGTANPHEALLLILKPKRLTDDKIMLDVTLVIETWTTSKPRKIVKHESRSTTEIAIGKDTSFDMKKSNDSVVVVSLRTDALTPDELAKFKKK